MQVHNQSGNGEIHFNDFIPKHPKRNKMYKKFYDLLFEFSHTHGYYNTNVQKMALNIERGIFNYALKLYLNSHNRNKKLTHWCDSFNIYYTNRCIIIYSNLNEKSSVKNTQLIKGLFNNEYIEYGIINDLCANSYGFNRIGIYGNQKIVGVKTRCWGW
jgi:hypothetical protein